MTSPLTPPFRSRRRASRRSDGNDGSEPRLQGEDFIHRAVVVVRLRTGADEAVAKEQWERFGLLVTRTEGSGQQAGMAVYRVEVRLNGSRWGALSEAERRVTASLAGRVTAQISDAALLAPEEPATAVSTWHVYRRTDWGSGWWRARAAHLWERMGAADVGRRVRLDGPGTREEALAALGRQPDLGGVVFDEQQHDVRPGIASAHTWSPPAAAPWHARAWGIPAMSVGAAVMVFGWVLAGLGPWWQIALMPLIPAAAWWVGSWIVDGDRHPAMIRWLCGLALVGSAGFCGFMGRVIATALGRAGGLWWVGALLGGLLVMRGCVYALRRSWFSRNVVALLPIAVVPLAWVLPWMGRLAQGIYLTDNFGIPLSAANADPVWVYLAGMKPAGLCIGAALCGLAALGWARHHYWITGSKTYCIATIGTSTAVAVLVALVAGLSSATAAAHRTAAQAAAGHDPSSFFGITARRVCVRPLEEKKTAVQPGPLPTTHPVIAFEVTGDETWLWDPQRAGNASGDLTVKTLRVRTDQVTTRPAIRGQLTCPWR